MAPADWDLRPEPAEIEVFETHWDALAVLLASSTQWDRVPTFGGGLYWRGLDYCKAEAVMRMMRIDPASVFEDLRAIEATMLPILNGAEAPDDADDDGTEDDAP